MQDSSSDNVDAMRTRVRIPDDEEEQTLASLAKLSEEDFEHFVSLLERPTSDINVHDQSDLVSSLQTAEGEIEFTAIYQSIIGLATVLSTRSLDSTDVADDIAAQLISKKLVESDSADALKSRLNRLLNIRNVIIANQVVPYPTAKSYSSSGIETRLKPFFTRTGGETPVIDAGLITHELRLQTYGDRSELFTCLMEEEDLRNLQQQIINALRERSALKNFLEKSNVTYVQDVN